MLLVTEEELDWLFSEVDLTECDSGRNNVKMYHDIPLESQVLIFTTFGWFINMPTNGMSVTRKEGGNREKCAEIGSCQGPKLVLLMDKEEETEACYMYIAIYGSIQQTTLVYVYGSYQFNGIDCYSLTNSYRIAKIFVNRCPI